MYHTAKLKDIFLCIQGKNIFFIYNRQSELLYLEENLRRGQRSEPVGKK